MRIGINALFFRYPASGSGQYLLHLLKALATLDQSHEYVLLSPRPDMLPFTPPPQMRYVAAPAPSWLTRNENIEKLVWEQITSPRAARHHDVDLLHIPYFAPPLRAAMPVVVTVHDVIPWHIPIYRAGAKIEAYMRLIEYAVRRATLIITVSEHAKRDIIDTLKLPAERIRVIYEAAGEEYQPVRDPEQLARARARYGLAEDQRYVFYLGGLDVRKNVPQLVRAFARVYQRLGEPDLRLLISGDPDRQRGPRFSDPRPLAAELGIADKVIVRFVHDEDKAALYSGAGLFVFPSLYEGFGLDPLEAMACGAPVVCSNRTSLPEVVGDAALCVDPTDLDALTDAMYAVLSDMKLEADLRARSLRRATQFSWQRTASETLAAYEAALSLE
ncbi:glycosyltransferase family 4 protein [Thermogemmatispora sp.]|uniref:glycosyltransferase family 4 protein n=1 Tax=Thermogemmatispora sp. TaxID=1968838 RepID=UPI001D352CC9|nr:glycosyltransferase family 1 protein [Thermogemmatispora sp.]MBX5451379.1 glycosyltransferase family 4 protein [Thermogemmatispora sp.]